MMDKKGNEAVAFGDEDIVTDGDNWPDEAT
jgi:hypothetical protein